MRVLATGLMMLALLAVAAAAPAQQVRLAEFEKSKLAIVTASGRHDFDVELAVTPRQRSQGLMFRYEMAEDAGMLFDFGPTERRQSMWMKNTYIPLDMLFIQADGKIERIAERTVPHSLEAISSRGRVRAVLELNAGTASRLGIRPGDRVEHRIFSAEK